MNIHSSRGRPSSSPNWQQLDCPGETSHARRSPPLEASDYPLALRWGRIGVAQILLGLSLFMEVALFLGDRSGLLPRGVAVLIALVSLGLLFLAGLIVALVGARFGWCFQFTVRSVLLATLLVAIPCSWLAVEMRRASARATAAAEVRRLGGSVNYDWQVDAFGTPLRIAGPPAPHWLREIVGDGYFARVVRVVLSDASDTTAAIEQAQQFGNLEGLILEDADITDAQLEWIEGLTDLRDLSLSGANITDSRLYFLEGLKNLQQLQLADTETSDAGLIKLVRLEKLRYLNLENTRITDAGLANLQEMKQLREIFLVGTKVTGRGITRFHAALPGCAIRDDCFKGKRTLRVTF
jgi:hypothetical protein